MIEEFNNWEDYNETVKGIVDDEFNGLELWYDINTPPLIFSEAGPVVIEISSQNLEATQHIPTIILLKEVNISLLQLSLSQKSPTYTYDFSQFISALQITSSLQSINILIGQLVYLNALGINVNLKNPTLAYDFQQALVALTLTLTQNPILTHYDFAFKVDPQAVEASLKGPAYHYDYYLGVSPQSISISQKDPDTEYDYALSVTAQGLIATPQIPVIDILKQVYVNSLGALLSFHPGDYKIVQSVSAFKPVLKIKDTKSINRITNIKSRLK